MKITSEKKCKVKINSKNYFNLKIKLRNHCKIKIKLRNMRKVKITTTINNFSPHQSNINIVFLTIKIIINYIKIKIINKIPFITYNVDIVRRLNNKLVHYQAIKSGKS